MAGNKYKIVNGERVKLTTDEIAAMQAEAARAEAQERHRPLRTLDGNGGNPSCNQGGIAVVAVQGSMIGRADKSILF